MVVARYSSYVYYIRKDEDANEKSLAAEKTTSMTENEKIDLPGAVPADYIEMKNVLLEDSTPTTDVTTVGDDTG